MYETNIYIKNCAEVNKYKHDALARAQYKH